MTFRIAVFCCLALLACGRTASAAPLTYDEAISGDLGFPYQTLNLDAGLNSIRGTMTWDLSNRKLDWDRFNLVVPEGMELTSFAFSLTPISNGMRRTRADISLHAFNPYTAVARGWLPFFNENDGLLFSAKPGEGLGKGLYQLLTGSVMELGGSAFAEFAYRFQINVQSLSPEPDPTPTPTPVPEPATLSLLALGLAGTGIRARRYYYCRRVASAAPPAPQS